MSNPIPEFATNIADADLSEKDKKIGAKKATFSRFRGVARSRSSQLPARRPVNDARLSHDPNARTSVERAPVEDSHHRPSAEAEHHASRARRDESTRDDGTRVRDRIDTTAPVDAPRGLGTRPCGFTRATRSPASARVTRYAPRFCRGREPESRGRAWRNPRAPVADDRRSGARTNARSPLFNRRTSATAASGFSRRSGSDRDTPNAQHSRPFVPRYARPRPSRRFPRALARSGARAPASPPAHQVRNNLVMFTRRALSAHDFANASPRQSRERGPYPARTPATTTRTTHAAT